MTRALAFYVVAALVAAPLAFGTDSNWIKRVLAHYKLHGDSPEGRTFATSALKYITTTRFSANAASDYVIATEEGVLVNGRYYDVALGPDVRVAMQPNGDWKASGKKAAVVNGTVFDEPDRVAALRTSSVLVVPADGAVAKAATAARALPVAERVSVVVDRTAPYVVKTEIITHPNDPEKRRVHLNPGVFVGAFECHIRVTFSEKMDGTPTVNVTQQNRPARPAGFIEDRNPIFTWQFFPDTSPDANGPAELAITGKDLAGNDLDPNGPGATEPRALVVDTVPPDLRRVDTSLPGNFRTLPKDGAVIAGTDFPKVIQAFVFDYDQPDDGTFDGANVTTANGSGVDWDALRLRNGSMAIRLFDPRGREIPGTMTARIPALELLLPDVYDPSNGIFPDTDSDGMADPIEGTYRIEVSIVDKAGNTMSTTLNWGMDATPISSKQLVVNLRPVLSDPFTNPNNPIPEQGTAIKRLDAIEITSPDPDFSVARSNAKLLFHSQGLHFRPVEVKCRVVRTDTTLTLEVLRDQNGDGVDDFENPAPGQYLPPGMVDPRWGKNDGLYVVEIDAVDKAGNHATQTRNVVLDTTAPQIGDTFPKEQVTIGAPLRMVDAILKDPKATSGADGAGISLDNSFIRLVFEGNDDVPAQDVKGVGFVHMPNPDDPTQPDFNPDDKFPKVLFEIVDSSGHVTSLPEDGSWDGVYRLEIVATDQAGNQVQGTASFNYSAATTSTTTAPLEMVLP